MTVALLSLIIFQSGYPVCRQAEEIMTTRVDGLGQISLRLLQSFSTRAYLSVTVSTFHSQFV